MGRYRTEYSLFGDGYELIGEKPDYKQSIDLIKKYRDQVQALGTVQFKITDLQTGTVTHFESTSKGIGIFSNLSLNPLEDILAW